MERRGLSDVVASVLLILLSVAAVALLITYVQPFVKNNLNRGSECLPYQGYYQFVESFESNGKTYDYNCYNVTGGRVYVGSMIKTTTDLKEDEINQTSGFTIVFSNEAHETKTISIIDGAVSSHLNDGAWDVENPLLSKLKPNGPGETKTFAYNLDKIYTSAEIYPLLRSGRTCEVSDSIKIKMCNGEKLNA